VALAVMLVVSGLGERHLAALSGDASVGNRLTVWKGGLQMTADVPRGVGAGNSGKFFMDWYQPLTAKEGYRTLVNSYLTFAAEFGLLWFGVGMTVVFGLLRVLVRAEAPGRGENTAWWLCVRRISAASWLAFLTAGFFSTTMESRVLWVPPLAGLLWVASTWFFTRRDEDAKANWSFRSLKYVFLYSWCGALLVVGLLYGAGCWLNSQDVLAREFRFQDGNLDSVILRNKDAAWAAGTCWKMQVDEGVLGRDYGKLLRGMLARPSVTRLTVDCRGKNDGAELVNDSGERILLMPLTQDWEKDAQVVLSSRTVERMPDELVRRLTEKRRLLVLGGAERNVAWYWDEIMDWMGKDRAK